MPGDSLHIPACPRCNQALPWSLYNVPGPAPCTHCGAGVAVVAFPSLFRPPEKGRGGDTLLIDSDASCFYHSTKQATIACEACGRFLCGLCDMELGGRHLCPGCVESGKRKKKFRDLQRERVLYDDLALGLSVLSLLSLVSCAFTFFALFLAPASLFVAIRFWKAPLSILRRTRIRLVFAMVLSLLQILGGLGFLIVAMLG